MSNSNVNSLVHKIDFNSSKKKQHNPRDHNVNSIVPKIHSNSSKIKGRSNIILETVRPFTVEVSTCVYLY